MSRAGGRVRVRVALLTLLLLAVTVVATLVSFIDTIRHASLVAPTAAIVGLVCAGLAYLAASHVIEPEDPTELRRRADLIESRECTGLTASWCPIHGDCSCPRAESLDDPHCPLHSPASSHAAPRCICDRTPSGDLNDVLEAHYRNVHVDPDTFGKVLDLHEYDAAEPDREDGR